MSDSRRPSDPDQDLPLHADRSLYEPGPPDLAVEDTTAASGKRSADPASAPPPDPWLAGPAETGGDLAFDPVTGAPLTEDPATADAALQEGPLASPPPDSPLSARPRRSPLVWALLALLLVALGLAAWWLLTRTPSTPETEPEAAPVVTTPEPTEPPPAEPATEPEAPPLELPPLEESDSLIAELVGELSSHPRLATWLGQEFLARRFVATVVNLADGESPRSHVPFTAPEEGFTARRRGDAWRAEARAYERYDPLVAVVTSLDPRGAARTYRQLSPLFEEAYRDLGASGSFDDVLARAMGRVLAVPVPEDAPELVPKGLGWAYADPRLEGLSAAEKHLLRLGPDNLRRVQQQTRALAAALGLAPR